MSSFFALGAGVAFTLGVDLGGIVRVVLITPSRNHVEISWLFGAYDNRDYFLSMDIIHNA